eukprot:TRINITY_DN3078_c0_g1_i4.p1 TRINITY_DN3078_c0_g1~~TRINITY_DN3078_c0_g1_i4.p1  ORF type:complete len:143 (+),score=6.88 TRINITY_DN3078_c0_g1_i4:132-560(+)
MDSRNNVELLLNTRVVSLNEASLATDDASPLPVIPSVELKVEFSLGVQEPSQKVLGADLVLWTVGCQSAVPSTESGEDGRASLPRNARGQVATEKTLRVKGWPRVFAIGDSAVLASPDPPLGGTAQVGSSGFSTVEFVKHPM